MVKCSIAEAYSILGVERGSTLEEVKTAYKQVALRTHPDKNPDNPEATVQFQQVSEAYRVISGHLERSGLDYDSGDYSSDYAEYGYDSDDDFVFYVGPHRFTNIYDMIFEMTMQDQYLGNMRYQWRSPRRSPRRGPLRPEETAEQFQQRVRQSRQEQLVAEERRKQEAAVQRETAERKREQERIDADERRKLKMKNRKAQAQNERQKAEETARLHLQKSQEARSLVFAAARRNDATTVKEGIYEKGVDAAGGEVKPGCEQFVKVKPKDLKQTLLHITTALGNLNLLEWLDNHGSEPDERDSNHLTAFHVALQQGRIPIVTYFFERYPPGLDNSEIYGPPSPHCLLSLAVDSGEPELVWMILDKDLATTDEINSSWACATSAMEPQDVAPAAKTPKESEKYQDILKLLMRYGGFTPPLTPQTRCPEREETIPKSAGDESPEEARQHCPSRSNGYHASKSFPPNRNRGRGHVRGVYNHRGRGRGRSRGRDRGEFPPSMS